jgi:hypothetical protein
MHGTAADFDAMSAQQRQTWLSSFQNEYQTARWFNAIDGVLGFAEERHLIRPGNWFGTVDVHILASINDGMRLYEGRSAYDRDNPGSAKWKEFFEELGSDARLDVLRSIWGPAEEAATQYGAGFGLGIAGVYRWAVGVPWLTSALPPGWDAMFDPRNSGHIGVIAGTVYDTANAVQLGLNVWRFGSQLFAPR